MKKNKKIKEMSITFNSVIVKRIESTVFLQKKHYCTWRRILSKPLIVKRIENTVFLQKKHYCTWRRILSKPLIDIDPSLVLHEKSESTENLKNPENSESTASFPFNARSKNLTWITVEKYTGLSTDEIYAMMAKNTLKDNCSHLMHLLKNCKNWCSFGKDLEKKWFLVIYEPMCQKSLENLFSVTEPLINKVKMLLLCFNTILVNFNRDLKYITRSLEKNPKVLLKEHLLDEVHPFPYKVFLILTNMAMLEELLPEKDTAENFLSVPQNQRKPIIISGQFNFVYHVFKRQEITPLILFKISEVIGDVFDSFSAVLKSDYKFSPEQKCSINSAKLLLRPKLERYITSYCIYYFQGLRKNKQNNDRILNILVEERYKHKETTFPKLFYNTMYFKNHIENELVAHYERGIIRQKSNLK